MKTLARVVVLVSIVGIFLFGFASNAHAQNLLCPEQLDPAINNGNALCTLQLEKALPNILNILLFVAFAAALVFLVYGGIRWVLSGGDKEGTSKAKGTVTAALIGLAIVLASWLLVNIVLYFFGVGNFSEIPTLVPSTATKSSAQTN